MAADSFHQRLRPEVAGDAEVAHHLLFLRLPQRFHRAALREYRVHVLHQADVVQLPEIQMIGLQQLQGFFDHAQAAIARALLGLAGEECLRAAPLHHRADVALAPAFRASIDRRSVDVIHAQIERPFHNRHRDGFVVPALQRGLPAEAEYADLVPCAPQVAHRHRRRSRRVLCRGRCARRLARRGMAHQSRRRRAAQFQESSSVSLFTVRGSFSHCVPPSVHKSQPAQRGRRFGFIKPRQRGFFAAVVDHHAERVRGVPKSALQ